MSMAVSSGDLHHIAQFRLTFQQGQLSRSIFIFVRKVFLQTFKPHAIECKNDILFPRRERDLSIPHPPPQLGMRNRLKAFHPAIVPVGRPHLMVIVPEMFDRIRKRRLGYATGGESVMLPFIALPLFEGAGLVFPSGLVLPEYPPGVLAEIGLAVGKKFWRSSINCLA